jgi:NitT/TauT family transport system substrate-binding protein
MNTFQKQTIGVFAALALTAGACSGTESTTAPAPVPAPAPAPSAPVEEPKPDPIDVRFSLEFLPTGYHAPYALAVKNGWYEEAGLNINDGTLAPGTGSAATVAAIAAGQFDMAIADLATFVTLHQPEMDVKAFGVMFGRAPTAVAVRESSDILRPEDLAGKSIAITTGGQDGSLLPAFQRRYGIEGTMDVVNAAGAAKTAAFIAGSVDSFVPFVCGTGVVVEQQEGVALRVFPLADAGIGLMGLGFLAREEFAAQHPDALAAFLEVSGRAWDYSRENPDEAVAATLAIFPELRAETVRGQLDCAFDYLTSERTADFPFGIMSESDWFDTIATLLRYLDVDAREPNTYYYSEFVR